MAVCAVGWGWGFNDINSDIMKTEELKQIARYANNLTVATYAPLLNQYMHEYNICGVEREAAFLATIIWESGSFKYTREIASGAAYEGRRDLGNIHPGDGRKFRGRGLIQLTGRANYERASKALGVDFLSNPELLEQPKYAVKVSCWWWAEHGVNEIADTGDFRAVTRKVNGGYNGMADRNAWYVLAKRVLAHRV